LGPPGTAGTNKPVVPAPGDYDDENIIIIIIIIYLFTAIGFAPGGSSPTLVQKRR
jgi:hypothetical protein